MQNTVTAEVAEIHKAQYVVTFVTEGILNGYMPDCGVQYSK